MKASFKVVGDTTAHAHVEDNKRYTRYTILVKGKEGWFGIGASYTSTYEANMYIHKYMEDKALERRKPYFETKWETLL